MTGTRLLLLLASLVWIAAIAYIGLRAWPVMSLDMAAGDPQVRAAYDAAVMAHVLRYALLAVAPPLALLLLARLLSRSR